MISHISAAEASAHGRNLSTEVLQMSLSEPLDKLQIGLVTGFRPADSLR